nr:hypothetical protein [Tanacetum cinerariifolium]
DFLLEEVDAFLAIEDDPTSSEFYQPYLDPEGDILLLEAFLNDDPSLPHPNQGNYLPEVLMELKICEAKSDKSSVDEPPEVELKDLPPCLEYAFLEKFLAFSRFLSSFLLDGYGIEAFGVGFEALTGAIAGSEIREAMGLEVKIGNSDWTT